MKTSTKLDKSTFPDMHQPEDFKAFGPPATKDGEFSSVKMADMGCFAQGDVDSNKYYHACVVQSKKNQKWFTYFEWGRVGAKDPQFQFAEYDSESEAQKAFEAQCHSKNDKRGIWTTVAGIKTLAAKPGKDVYLVRPLSSRSTGLPDAKTIKINECVTKQVNIVKNSKKIDDQTLKLMRDLNIGTVSYARGEMADSSLPTKNAIDEARNLLQEAQKRLIVVGDNIDAQVSDKEMMQLTSVLYSRIPKKKSVNAGPETWMLSQNNILLWQQDIDAFESALSSDKINVESDPFAGMPLEMQWIDPQSTLGKFLYNWWPKATANRHGGVGAMKIKNIWQVDRHGDQAKLESSQEVILKNKPTIKERPLFQPRERVDLEASLVKRYNESNTALLFHGTRSVNVSGILRESFRFPKQLTGVVITGAMFGSSANYQADDWKKSAGYTSLSRGYYSYGGGSIQGREAFMFACDTVLGVPHVAPGPKGYTSPPTGCHSVFGKAGFSGVQNNEWMIYNTNQTRLKYLLEFSA